MRICKNIFSEGKIYTLETQGKNSLQKIKINKIKLLEKV